MGLSTRCAASCYDVMLSQHPQSMEDECAGSAAAARTAIWHRQAPAQQALLLSF